MATIAQIMGLRLLAFCSILLFCLITNGTAQPQPSLTQRRNLAAALNTAKGSLFPVIPPFPSMVSAPINSLGPISVRTIHGNCTSLNDVDPGQDNEVQVIRPNSDPDCDYFILKVMKHPASEMKIPPESHNLVCNLNAWLWFAWGGEYKYWIGGDGFASDKNVMGRHEIASQCKNPTDTQTFSMGRILGTNWSKGYNPSDPIRNGQQMWYAVAGQHTYDIIEYNSGTSSWSEVQKGGHELFSFNVTTGNNVVQYIDSFQQPPANPLNPRDTAIAKIAFSEITFNYPSASGIPPSYPGGGARKVITRITVQAHTQEYPSDCSPAFASGEVQPSPTNAGVSLTFDYIDYDQSGTPTGSGSCTRTFTHSDPYYSNSQLWSAFSWSDHISWNWARFEIDEFGFLTFNVFGAAPGCGSGETGVYHIMRLRDPAVPAEYCNMTLPSVGEFCVDNMTGNLKYVPGTCALPTGSPIDVSCIDFCDPVSGYTTIDGVVSAAAARMGDDWVTANSQFQVPKVLDTWWSQNWTNNNYETGIAGKWRPQISYAYRSAIKGPIVPGTLNYDDAGVFTGDQGQPEAFRLFNWQDSLANIGTKWLPLSTVTIASPFGQPLEERDILGNYSASRFAHRNTIPGLVARNARYNAVGFESFEDEKFAGKSGVTTDHAHAGRNCLRLPDQHAETVPIMTLTTDEQLMNKPLIVSVWVKRTYTDMATDIPIRAMNNDPFAKVAQTGEWSLYQKQITAPSTLGTTVDIRFSNLSDDVVWIDDARAQPADAEMICYVYDPATLRLATQFDDNHFGLYYQYNREGKLVRKLKETERGLKTVVETQYHTPLAAYRDGTVATGIQRGGNGGYNLLPQGSNAPFDSQGDAATPATMGTSFDLLDIEIGPDGHKTKAFGLDGLPDLDSLKLPLFDPSSMGSDRLFDIDGVKLFDLERLELPGISDLDKAEAFRRIAQLDAAIDSLSNVMPDTLTTEDRARVNEEAYRLREQRKNLVEKKLGITEDEFRRLLNDLKKEENDEQQ